MKISSTTLRAIADKLDQLEKIDADITSFRLHGLSITIKSASDQMDGRTLYVVRITEHAGLLNTRQREVIQPSPRARLDPAHEFTPGPLDGIPRGSAFDDDNLGANDPELQ